MPEPEEKHDMLDKKFLMEFSLVAPCGQEYPYGNESLYRDCISDVMRKDGWIVQTEVRTEFGIADLVARRENETWVIEVKLLNDNNSMAHACGQLLFYTASINCTRRIVATPDKLNSCFVYEALRLNKIESFEFTDYYFPSKSLFDDRSRLKRHHNMIESSMLTLQKLMIFINDEEPMQDADTRKLWNALADMLAEAATAVRQYAGDSKPALTVIRGDAA